MKTINKDRAIILTTIKNQEREDDSDDLLSVLNCEITVNTLIVELLQNVPAYKEFKRCSSRCADSERSFPNIPVHSSLRPSLDNLMDCITSNFPTDIDLVFIEVIDSNYFTLSKLCLTHSQFVFSDSR